MSRVCVRVGHRAGQGLKRVSDALVKRPPPYLYPPEPAWPRPGSGPSWMRVSRTHPKCDSSCDVCRTPACSRAWCDLTGSLTVLWPRGSWLIVCMRPAARPCR